mmetsp:Transcript_33876/g.55962  ORF Transcript_33876/g.55962 Transcript_33876/m.55962 type:complete len:287 (+) Transcript_33876:29-889(+)|eukprot:CAMPEP_0119311636 /NCGR_PEP_ID=MMETSP1333-20130426/23182_1 /TAXON_ID=418940 /ORGANISM="Scyphosphaera apsteinii, Strain RCC1455" /LENGTH=286 /DNA_ID=CAMNT_0007316063 /DNA_START=29 /DNA_END=889 /DNA_ORIENTATION=+
MKRRADDDEEAAEAEIAAAISAAKQAPADEEIDGLFCGIAMVHFDVKATPCKQYKSGRQHGEKPLILIYLCIRGLGETPKLMLAEAGAEYTHLASPMGEVDAVSCEWRKRSPNGLTPLMSGLGVPRAKPLSQSSTIIRFLAQRYGMAGDSDLEGFRADNLFETAKDLKGKKDEIKGFADSTTSGAKGPIETAERIAAMLEEMPDPADDTVALNYAQLELLNTLIECDEDAPGCVKELSPTLDAFRAAGVARPRIANYLSSPLRFPPHCGPNYKYTNGPVVRSSFTL